MNKSKIFMIVSVCILCISVIGATFAYYVQTLFTVETTTITHGLDYYINYTKGNNITDGVLNPTNSYVNGLSSDIELWKTDNTYDIYGHIYIDINTMSDALSDSSGVKYAIVNNNSVIAEGTVAKNTDNAVLLKSNIPLEISKQLYTVYIWLDENADLDTELTDQELSLSVRCEATMKTI